MRSLIYIMQKYLIILAVIISISAEAQLWTEDFSAEVVGATSGTAGGTIGGSWINTYAGSGTFSKQNVLIAGAVLNAVNTGTEAVWTSNVLDISTVGYAIITADVWSALVEGNDYVRMYYKLDGGPEILFYELIGGNALVSLTPAQSASAIVAANTVQVVIRIQNDFNVFIFTFNDVYAIDNINITAAPVIYSRKSGTWTDVTGGIGGTGTWSLTGHNAPTSCGCVPLNTQVAIIGNGHMVTLPSSQTTIGTPPTTNLAPGAVDVTNTGTLQFNTNGVTLGIQQGLLRVRNGGTINSSSGAITNERISFLADVGGARLQVDAGGTASFDDLLLASGATNTHFLEGGGSLTITDGIVINANGASLTNNLTTPLAVGDNIIFNGDDSDLTNNGNISIGGDIAAFNTDDDGNEVINSTGSTLSFINMDGLATGSGLGAFLSILNSGTINQSGTFIDIETSTDARNDINNLNGGVWNYSGTGHDLDLRLFANNGVNSFNYGLGGDQNIITPVTGNGYSNINLQNSGVKTALAGFNVYGNWSRTGTATYTPAGTVTFIGTSSQTISAVGSETFVGLTINNSSGISINNPVTVTGTLTMTIGNIDLNGNLFTLGTSAGSPGVLSYATAGNSNNGYMYDGSLRRFMAASNGTNLGGAEAERNEGFFPLGSSSDFRPFYVGKNNNAGTGGSITVTHNDAANTSIVNIPDTTPVATITRRHDSNWAVTTSGITGGTWALRAGGTNFGTIQEVADIRLSTSASVVGTNAIAIGGPSDWRANRTGLTFGQLTNSFHIASTDAVNSPLPIELVFFKGLLVDDAVRLLWETASELNNEFFTVERLNEGDVFDPIAVVKGSGTVNETKTYQAFDYTPKEGRNYYRLKQTDFDGKISYSNMVMVDFKDEGEIVNVYPNPTAQETITIELKQLRPGQQVPLQIRSMIGVQTFSSTFTTDSTGSIKVRIQVGQWPRGLYLVQIGTSTPVQRKIIIE